LSKRGSVAVQDLMNGLVKQKTTSGAKKVEEKPDLIDKNALIHQMNRTSHLNNDAMQDEG